MSASLEAEQKAKGEALRVKKALEGEINELEIGLDHANKANSEVNHFALNLSFNKYHPPGSEVHQALPGPAEGDHPAVRGRGPHPLPDHGAGRHL